MEFINKKIDYVMKKILVNEEKSPKSFVKIFDVILSIIICARLR